MACVVTEHSEAIGRGKARRSDSRLRAGWGGRVMMEIALGVWVRVGCREGKCERYRKREQDDALETQRSRLDTRRSTKQRESVVVAPCSRALSFKELSRADTTPQQFAHTRTKDRRPSKTDTCEGS